MGGLLQTTPLSIQFSITSKTDCTHFIDKETRVLQLQLRGSPNPHPNPFCFLGHTPSTSTEIQK